MTDVSLSESGGLKEFYRAMNPPQRRAFWARVTAFALPETHGGVLEPALQEA